MEIIIKGERGEGKTTIALAIADALLAVGIAVSVTEEVRTRTWEQQRRALSGLRGTGLNVTIDDGSK